MKRLIRVGKEIVATSDNRKYSPEILRGPDLKRLKMLLETGEIATSKNRKDA